MESGRLIFHSHRFSAQLIPLLLVGAMLVGCDGAAEIRAGGGELVTGPLEEISIYQLAGRLDMRVVRSSAISATLEDLENVVTIFPDPGACVYVNGALIARTGGIVPVREILFVPVELEGVVREALRQRPKRAPPVGSFPPLGSLGCVVLDPGHGGKDPGAISVLDYPEKRVNLFVALTAAGELRQRGVEVVLTRQTDRFVELNRRAEIANQCNADLFVSIHADSARNRSAKGFTVYTSHNPSSRSQHAARTIAQHFEKLGIESRGIRRANYRVLVRTTCPAVLVELGYLSNKSEAQRLSQTSHRRSLSHALSDAIVQYLKYSY